jgi:hypothetical protein
VSFSTLRWGEAIRNPEQAWRFEEARIPDQAFGLSGMTVL